MCDGKEHAGGSCGHVPFSYELGHLFLHLFPLQLFLQQNLESCDAAVALGIPLIVLQCQQ